MRTYAVTSGKGGVGKTNLSANLGIAFAALGKRTVVFDADIGLANLDVVLGVKAERTLQDVFNGEVPLSDVIQDGPGGIRFIAGGSGIDALVNLSGPKSDQFLTDLNALEESTDVLIFDTGAGIDGNVMTFLMAADEVLLVITPDPASVTDSYATAKALLQQKPDSVVRVVMNMVDDEAHARAVYAKVFSIAMQFLNRRLEFGGFIRTDMQAAGHVRKRQPFFVAGPGLPASKDVKALATTLLGETVAARNESLVDRLKSVFSFRKAA